MALLPILHYPDQRLHKVAKPVQVVDDRIRQLVRDMAETMYDAPGVGLAATQVAVHERVVVIDVSEEGNDMLRSEEHTSELQSLMRNSYAVFCSKKKNKTTL